jgi:hypothetical protein
MFSLFKLKLGFEYELEHYNMKKDCLELEVISKYK